MPDLIINRYLDELIKQDASDMYLTVGYPAGLRTKDHSIKPITKTALRPSDIDKFISEILKPEQKKTFDKLLELNLSIIREDGSRFRINFFRQQQNNGIIIRRISTKIPTLEQLGLPEIYSKVILKKRGLLILASPGGSGKSTSMAAMIGHRNHHGSGHILTIEDPIEFVHKHDRCVITQREVGMDTYSYEAALKNALRQRADVIVIGEIRDKEAMDHALRFAETGHLCVATLHANNSSQAIDRIVNFFPENARSYVLSTLSQNLITIFSQRLLHNLQGGNSIAVEILLNEGLIKNLIADDKISELKEAIERNHDSGMQTLDQSILDLFANKEISLETAMSEAENPSSLNLKIHQNNLSSSELIRAQQKPAEEEF